MARESEIKLSMQDPAAVLRECLALGAVETQPRQHEENLVFDRPGRSLLGEGKLLRVRRYAGQVLVTFKGPISIRDHIKHREELEFLLDSIEVFPRFLENLGFTVQFRYEKYRQILELEESRLRAAAGQAQPGTGRVLKIMFDETPIGNYLELEGEEDLIHEAAARLGFARTDYITRSYSDLYDEERRKRGWSGEDMVFGR